jgi:branched-chain amino acid transport system permease protein
VGGAFLPPFYMHMMTVVLIFSLFAVSFNLLMGFGGLVSFGHAAFFGLGGYAYALLLVHTGMPTVPAMVLAPFVVAAFGLVVGAFCVRLHGILFAMLTLAFGQIIWAIVQGWYSFTGGDDGIVGISRLAFVSSLRGQYTLTAVVAVAGLAVLFTIIRSTFGQTLNAARQNRERVAAIGVNVARHRLIAFVISTFFSGLAGVLLAQLEGSMFPVYLYWTTGAQVLIMSLVGGIATLSGPVVGALLITGLRYWLGTVTVYWPMVLGIILVVTVLFFREGLVGAALARIGSRGVPDRKLDQETAESPGERSQEVRS